MEKKRGIINKNNFYYTFFQNSYKNLLIEPPSLPKKWSERKDCIK